MPLGLYNSRPSTRFGALDSGCGFTSNGCPNSRVGRQDTTVEVACCGTGQTCANRGAVVTRTAHKNGLMGLKISPDGAREPSFFIEDSIWAVPVHVPLVPDFSEPEGWRGRAGA